MPSVTARTFRGKTRRWNAAKSSSTRAPPTNELFREDRTVAFALKALSRQKAALKLGQHQQINGEAQ